MPQSASLALVVRNFTSCNYHSQVISYNLNQNNNKNAVVNLKVLRLKGFRTRRHSRRDRKTFSREQVENLLRPIQRMPVDRYVLWRLEGGEAGSHPQKGDTDLLSSLVR